LEGLPGSPLDGGAMGIIPNHLLHARRVGLRMASLDRVRSSGGEMMRTITWLTLAGALLLAASCQSDGFFKREVRKLEGLSEARLAKRFGPPERVSTNMVGDLIGSPEPWHAPIPQALSMFPTNTPGNLQVQIKSLSWPQGRIVLTVWLHQKGGQWVSFYAEEWNMDVVE